MCYADGNAFDWSIFVMTSFTHTGRILEFSQNNFIGFSDKMF